jgi:DNA polymerase III delta prime subunit
MARFKKDAFAESGLLDLLNEEDGCNRLGDLLEKQRKTAAKAFASDAKMLEAFEKLLTLRHDLGNSRRDLLGDATLGRKKLAQLERLTTKQFHVSLTKTKATPLGEYVAKHRLEPLEIEALMCLIFHRLGFHKDSNSRIECREILDMLCQTAGDRIEGMRVLSENGKLTRHKLICPTDEDEELLEQEFVLNPDIEARLLEGGGRDTGWQLKYESEFMEKLPGFIRLAAKKDEMFADIRRGFHNSSEFFRIERAFNRRLIRICDEIRNNPNWKFSQFVQTLPSKCQDLWQLWTLILLCKEQGLLNADSKVFTGAGLTAIASFSSTPNRDNLKYLKTDAPLLQANIIRPCGGIGTFLDNDDTSIAEAEFELTPQALETLGIEKRLLKKREGECEVRKARVSFEQLALPAKTKRDLEMATAQSKHAELLFGKWGLGEAFSYGRGTTILFYGPPGVGKTASAEAMAHQLEKPILVADYSSIQSCWVGQTGKNITRTFREAKAHDAVLFWDEADAMFYDRNSTSHNWEVRDVNILLQEIENFDGVCILSTNRQVTMDAALERRISLKVEFKAPEGSQCREMWQKMLPEQLPLHPDVSIDVLSEAPLTGGEIKNVILNAARLASIRGEKTQVTQQDFEEAIALETKGRWNKHNSATIGFQSYGQLERGMPCL